MNDGRKWRERAAWLAAVAGLSTSLAWLTVVFMLVLLRGHTLPAPATAILRAVAHVLLALAPRAWPMLLLALGGMMLAIGGLALAARRTALPRRKVRHA